SMRFLSLVALATVATLTSCSDDEAAKSPIPLDNLRSEFESANCDFEVRCTQMPDKGTCKKVDRAEYELLQLTADAAFRKVKYDPVAARIWVEIVRGQAGQATVAVATTLENAWDLVFVGTVGKGGPCLVDDECAGTSACDRSMCGNGPACCAGVCTPRPKHVPLGGDCSMGTCEDSAYCDTEG